MYLDSYCMAQRLANVSLLATESLIGYKIAISKCSTEQSFLTSFLSKWPASLQVAGEGKLPCDKDDSRLSIKCNNIDDWIAEYYELTRLCKCGAIL